MHFCFSQCHSLRNTKRDERQEGKMRLILGLIMLIFSTATAVAVDPDECKQQRAQYPTNWADVSNEQTLFDCSSHYAGEMRVKVGASEGTVEQCSV
jgi:hypothetical protein